MKKYKIIDMSKSKLNKISKISKTSRIAALLIVAMLLSSCNFDFLYSKEEKDIDVATEIIATDTILTKKIYIDFTAPYATYSIINDGYATLYYHNPLYDDKATMPYIRKVVAVNAGHGTKGGSKIKTFSHPDFTPKVSGGTNQEGSILSSAISDGTVLKNGMTEASVNLMVATALKDKLLESDFDVLMIRENDDTRLDNIARTVIANKFSDIHIAIHFDSTETDKGIFYITPFNDENYLAMEPLKSNAQNIKRLGKTIIDTYKEMGEKIWKESGTLQGDLTQISYSTNPSVDIELGDKATVIDDEKVDRLAEGLRLSVIKFFEG